MGGVEAMSRSRDGIEAMSRSRDGGVSPVGSRMWHTT